jgi:antitoxin (DNA-binding transcriptional repressor) of toxin-antitoxin stability system
MKFAGIKELKHKTRELIEESKEGDIIITAYGKPTAILHHIGQEELEDYLIENESGFRQKIEAAFKDYLAQGGITADELIDQLEKKLEAEKL